MGSTFMIKDVALLRKLYPMAVPVAEHFRYYVEQLRSALECKPPLDFEWLEEALANFEDLEETRPDPAAYVAIWRDRLARYLTDIEVETLPRWEPTRKVTFPKMEAVERNVGKRMVRIDLISANYSALRSMCPALPSSWADLCRHFGIHDAVDKSKAFRQSVLGLLNPRRQQAFQTEITDEIAEILRDEPLKMVRRSPDELVYDMSDALRHSVVNCLERYVKCVARLPYRIEYFDLQPLGFMKGYLWRNFASAEAQEPTSVRPFMVPGNRFYLALTRTILKERVVDVRDYSYIDDGELTRWAFDFNRGSHDQG